MIEYKNYIIKPHAQVPTSYIVVTAGQGGKIPMVLSSLFTTPSIAKEAIDEYLKIKEVKNAKASSQSGD